MQTPQSTDSDALTRLLSKTPATAAGLMQAAKSKLESLRHLPSQQAAKISSEVKDLTVHALDAAGATVAAMIACD